MPRILASITLAASFAAVLVLLLLQTTSAQQPASRLTVLDRAGEPITALVDGNVVRLGVDLTEIARQTITVSFHLTHQSDGAPGDAPEGQEPNALHLADCVIAMGSRGCVTPAISTLGWFWDEGAQVRPQRVIHAYDTAHRETPLASAHVDVTPRPVVLVHGFVATYNTWEDYLGPSGYLAQAGLHGFAVGDGQVTGTMHTGKLLKPYERTNTIAENAAALGEYIGHVKAETGAEQVDLLAHSMGGLIARYYIDRLMLQANPEPDIAQLIMLGTPNAGSDCALLIVGIGGYQPASLELRSDYVRHIFNPQITRNHGVPFYLLAGTPIRQQSFSACSQAPNDLVVSLESAAAIRTNVATELIEVPVLHIHLNESRALFEEQVVPLLRASAAEFAARRAAPIEPLPAESAEESTPAQFSQVYTGFVAPQDPTRPQSNTHIIHIDANVAVASFGLYDPSRSLTVTVRGASGNVITLDANRNGLTIVEDPDSLLYLGYGFENPRPGPWLVTVHPTQRTPPLGTEYALMAQYVGGAALEVDLNARMPSPDERVHLTATLELGGEPLLIERATIRLHHPDGRTESMRHSGSGYTLTALLDPQPPGLYGIDITAAALLPDHTWVERAAYVAFEVAEAQE